MRILFIDPPGKSRGLNSGLAYLAAALKESFPLRVLDLNNIPLDLCGGPNPAMPVQDAERKIRAAAEEFRPDVVGVSVKTSTAGISGHIVEFIKSGMPKIITLAGGPHITLDGRKFIAEHKVDFGVIGEGEDIALRLLKALEGEGRAEEIDGALYWQDGRLGENPPPPLRRNLDALPFPDFSAFSSVMENRGRIIEYPLLSSRGCPCDCSFCTMPSLMGRTWRSHTPERVVAELKEAGQKYGCTRFTVVDDNFTLNTGRAERICDLLVAENIRLPWNSQNGIRADHISPNLAAKMKRSGCTHVWIGVESADEDVFRHIKKGETLDNIREGIRALKQARIRVGGFFIVGLPLSTREADLASVNFVRAEGIDGWWFNFVPYLRTRAWDWIEAHGRWLRSPEDALQYGSGDIEPVFETDDYPREIRVRTYREIHVRLGLFERLADPFAKKKGRWRKVYSLVRPFGLRAILSFLIFILKRNVRRRTGTRLTWEAI
jgi:radical SAM superfamily enzyme YgiQ (UPF0313 family)